MSVLLAVALLLLALGLIAYLLVALIDPERF
ncbi:K(+)-transporting ATPase subunit F [Corynebacterium anserum]|uniref:K(+)-transporting ATPase subunit F n=1 Tax=Corynebacterium anserum TaxID=2684406 RepID=A0A7G7YMJ2_9CORY|nr:K(+)-transporting ATPase subunit F [Corynebacterium anserum]MBC2681081.1 K(+)-transporting ATPase subunit F [Corynebacterium anserum]QNH95712.1 K(+)-transporting ATPase subunit F [Corynebacterium anserum]